MKPFEIEGSDNHPYSRRDKITVTNDRYKIEIWVDNECCESFAWLDLECNNTVFDSISHIEVQLSENNVLNLHENSLCGEIHLPINRIELKDINNQTIFRVRIRFEEASLTQTVHLVISDM